MPYYICHPGTVKLDRTGEDAFYTAAEIASLYGLVFGEYTVGSDQSTGSIDPDHIHLYPRTDEKYRDIKTELGDTPDGTYYDYPANYKKKKRQGQEYDRLER